jgi:hypothetical protein
MSIKPSPLSSAKCDGLVDFIYSKGIDRKTYINTGQGWLENSSYKLNEPIVNDTNPTV